MPATFSHNSCIAYREVAHKITLPGLVQALDHWMADLGSTQKKVFAHKGLEVQKEGVAFFLSDCIFFSQVNLGYRV